MPVSNKEANMNADTNGHSFDNGSEDNTILPQEEKVIKCIGEIENIDIKSPVQDEDTLLNGKDYEESNITQESLREQQDSLQEQQESLPEQQESLQEVEESLQKEEEWQEEQESKQEEAGDDNGQVSNTNEDDLPLCRLLKNSDLDAIETVEKVEVTKPLLHPYSHVRSRAALRSGSPLNSSFTVRSEPCSPSGLGFPRLHKAEAHLSLTSPAPSRKRTRTEAFPDSPSGKRQRWLNFNLARWWRGEAEVENEAPILPPSAAEALAQAPESVSRSCSIM